MGLAPSTQDFSARIARPKSEGTGGERHQGRYPMLALTTLPLTTATLIRLKQ
jgi:hypothetical protein